MFSSLLSLMLAAPTLSRLNCIPLERHSPLTMSLKSYVPACSGAVSEAEALSSESTNGNSLAHSSHEPFAETEGASSSPFSGNSIPSESFANVHVSVYLPAASALRTMFASKLPVIPAAPGLLRENSRPLERHSPLTMSLKLMSPIGMVGSESEADFLSSARMNGNSEAHSSSELFTTTVGSFGSSSPPSSSSSLDQAPSTFCPSPAHAAVSEVMV